MKSKRRASRRTRTRNSTIAMLGGGHPARTRMGERDTRLAAARGWARGEPTRIQRIVHAPGFRVVVIALSALALSLGALASNPLIERVQGDQRSEAPVRVQSIAVQGNTRLSATAVAHASGVAPDSIATEVDPEQVRLNLEKHPWIGHANTALLPDGKLVIRIEEREPAALVRGPASAGDKPIWRLLDATGTPFVGTRAEEWSRLPRFRSERVLATGEAEPALVEALTVARLVHGHTGTRLTTREVELPAVQAGRGWVLHSQTLPHTVILGENELESRLQELALLLDSDLPSARGAVEIDLRFADLAVLRSSSPSR